MSGSKDRSLTYWLAALTSKGVTFVVMPSLSLIQDDLNYLIGLSIPAVTQSVVNI